MERLRREVTATKRVHNIGVEPGVFGQHDIQRFPGLDFDQGLKDRAWTKLVKVLSLAPPAKIGDDLGADYAEAAARGL